jgi:hypothetical protein
MRETVNWHQPPEWLLGVLRDIEERASLLRWRSRAGYPQ